VATGILATVMPEHTVLEYMFAPIRYRWSNDLVLRERHDEVQLEITGDEPLRFGYSSAPSWRREHARA
jgi:hypothetical protein